MSKTVETEKNAGFLMIMASETSSRIRKRTNSCDFNAFFSIAEPLYFDLLSLLLLPGTRG